MMPSLGTSIGSILGVSVPKFSLVGFKKAAVDEIAIQKANLSDIPVIEAEKVVFENVTIPDINVVFDYIDKDLIDPAWITNNDSSQSSTSSPLGSEKVITAVSIDLVAFVDEIFREFESSLPNL